ncbi:methyltransferase domain-containing protein [Saccharothrix hoggarensis]|uniref:Protein-L-isoaspartate O-methyltransferase n=1 Tax=Saccharothrix hoggarensis TaxID=913853 RepID=A0ABW3QSX0_9PSEU
MTAEHDWVGLAAALAADLTGSGELRDPAWADAVAATPRHLLVPTAYRQQPDGSWVAIDTAGPGPAPAYSATTLVTEVDDRGRAVSSSTKPDLMVRMLELLDVRDGHRVLEIGTGTGYNAALLSHRLGADRVFSLDVDAKLVAHARERLAAIGHRPRLAARDGIAGWPAHGPYDRIIATCSVPRIPWAWAEQTAPDGAVLADLKVGPGAGNLVLLHRHGDRLEGRFASRWAAFMTMRHHTDDGPPVRGPKAAPGPQRDTTAPAQPWNTHREVWLLACLTLPPDVRYGYTLDQTTRAPKATTLSAPDGSWCEVDLTSDGTPARVREGGPTPLWTRVERAWDAWTGWGEPGWGRFGLTVTPDTHALWLDEPGDVIG